MSFYRSIAITGHRPGNSEIDASIIYADYYYLEALLRLNKTQYLKGIHAKTNQIKDETVCD